MLFFFDEFKTIKANSQMDIIILDCFLFRSEKPQKHFTKIDYQPKPELNRSFPIHAILNKTCCEYFLNIILRHYF